MYVYSLPKILYNLLTIHHILLNITVRRYLLSTNMLVIHLLTLSNNHLKFSTKEEQMDG